MSARGIDRVIAVVITLVILAAALDVVSRALGRGGVLLGVLP